MSIVSIAFATDDQGDLHNDIDHEHSSVDGNADDAGDSIRNDGVQGR